MRDEFEYLSDEQLQTLIDECENGNMISAPIGFADNVLQMISDNDESISEADNNEENALKEQQERRPVTISFEQKLKEYKRFRLQVSVAVAAAVIFLVVSPILSIERLRPEGGKSAVSNLGNSKVLTEFFGQHNIDEKFNERDLFDITEGE